MSYCMGGGYFNWRRETLKVRVVVAIKMATGRSQVAGMWEAVRTVNKQLVESPMGAMSEYRG